MINLCTGGIIYHRNHETMAVDVSRLNMRDGIQFHEQVGLILPGASLTFEDGGCKITVENPCIHEWASQTQCVHCGQARE